MEKIKANSSVLVISDYFEKFDFIQNHLIWQSLIPAWYYNIRSVEKYLKHNSFSMVIIDLSLPIESKLELIKNIYSYQPDMVIMTIGKVSFLNKTGVLSHIPDLLSIDSLYSFPDELEILTGKKVSLQNAGVNSYDSTVHTLH